MVSFGGMGGVEGGRPLDTSDLFAVAVERTLGDLIRNDHEVGVELWSALANQGWHHENGDTASYSFRAAGDLVASVVGEGDYMDWYCSGPTEVVTDRIRRALRRAGWHPTFAKDFRARAGLSRDS